MSAEVVPFVSPEPRAVWGEGEPAPVPAWTMADGIDALPPIDYDPDCAPGLIADELRYVIERWILADPRTQQKAIGPSEIGTPCARRLTYSMADHPRAVPEPAAWRPTVGRAVHTFLAEVFDRENASFYARHGTYRYLVERRVDSGQINGYGDLNGTGDLYDRATGTVVDWKIVGRTSLNKYRRRMRPEYVVQCMTYGLGWRRLGLPVNRIILACLPMAGELAEAVWHHAIYNEDMARQAMRRAERVNGVRVALGIPTAMHVTNGALRGIGQYAASDPRGLDDALAIPMTDDAGDCTYCPWLLAGSDDLARGCPGVAGMPEPYVKPVARSLGSARIEVPGTTVAVPAVSTTPIGVDNSQG